ncbi:MAG: aminotransferase class IV, partial [Deltaproteobacteria bacterium]|nr:aminotransferase class IV [Deltaproteobacteria bacterium]
MPHKIYINGKLVPENSASISVFDRSYLYGEGVFETMRAYKGRPAFCDMHYHRLKSNCEKLKIELPVD